MDDLFQPGPNPKLLTNLQDYDAIVATQIIVLHLKQCCLSFFRGLVQSLHYYFKDPQSNDDLTRHQVEDLNWVVGFGYGDGFTLNPVSV